MSQLTENALSVLNKRYFLKDKNGNIVEDWEGLCNRVVNCIVQAESEELREGYRSKFYDMMYELKFLPNSPTMFNAGTKLGTLSACYVLPVEDDMSSIFTAVKNGALIHQRGGGTGYSFDLRPSGAVVKSTQGKASGPLSFMKVFDAATDVITQSGRRSGANMGILPVHHPDIMDFVKVKQDDPKAFTNFNFSVAITDEFMEALEKDGEIELRHQAVGVTGTIKAKEIWDAILEGAWKCGDPGVIFIDTINKGNTTPHLGPIQATNPCVTGDTMVATSEGLIPIKELVEMRYDVKATTPSGPEDIIDYIDSGENDVWKIATESGRKIKATEYHKFIVGPEGREVSLKDLQVGDTLYTYNTHLQSKPDLSPIESIQYVGKEHTYCLTVTPSHRMIVNGIVTGNCGESPLLPYESCNLGSINLTKFVNNGRVDWTGLEETTRLATRFLDNVIDVNNHPVEEIKVATERTRKIGIGVMGFAHMLTLLGIPYGSDKSFEKARKVMKFIQDISHDESEKLGKEKGLYPAYKEGCPKRRNAITTIIAPTGSLATISGVSFGIEPIYAVEYTRTTGIDDGGKPLELKMVDPFYEEALSRMSKAEADALFVASHNISVEAHLQMQAAFQQYTDNAVSKTINFSNSATKEDIDKAYRLAYKLGLKGTTIYRDGSRDIQVLNKKGQTHSRSRIDIPEDQLRILLSDKGMSVEDVADIYGCSAQTVRNRVKEYNITLSRAKPRRNTTPEESTGWKAKIKTTLGTVHLQVNEDEDNYPYESFIIIGKAGEELTAMCEALGKSISNQLQYNIPLENIISLYYGIGGEAVSYGPDGTSSSIPDAVARKLKSKYLKGFKPAPNLTNKFVNKCPDCGAELINEGGCTHCSDPSCGYSECG